MGGFAPGSARGRIVRTTSTDYEYGLRQFPKQAFVFVVIANPKPRNRSGRVFYAQRTVGLGNSHAPNVPVGTVQAKRWVPGTFFQQVVLLASVVLNPPREFPKAAAESPRGLVG